MFKLTSLLLSGDAVEEEDTGGPESSSDSKTLSSSKMDESGFETL